MNSAFMENIIFWSGIAHFALCLGSLYVPIALRWHFHLSTLQALLRQMFWTYATYILVTNLSFGIVSVLGSDELLNGSFLAKSITLFIGIYWLARILVQFFLLDKSEAPEGLLYTIGEILLVGLFGLFAVTYLVAFAVNCEWI